MKGKCKNNSGYYNLTEGKEYEIVELIPQLHTPNFTFPRYVRAIDNNGRVTQCHAYRFETLEGESFEDYIKDNIKDIKDYEY